MYLNCTSQALGETPFLVEIYEDRQASMIKGGGVLLVPRNLLTRPSVGIEVIRPHKMQSLGPKLDKALPHMKLSIISIIFVRFAETASRLPFLILLDIISKMSNYDTELRDFPSIFSLRGKVVVVTGGSRGLGLHAASGCV